MLTPIPCQLYFISKIWIHCVLNTLFLFLLCILLKKDLNKYNVFNSRSEVRQRCQQGKGIIIIIEFKIGETTKQDESNSNQKWKHPLALRKKGAQSARLFFLYFTILLLLLRHDRRERRGGGDDILTTGSRRSVKTPEQKSLSDSEVGEKGGELRNGWRQTSSVTTSNSLPNQRAKSLSSSFSSLGLKVAVFLPTRQDCEQKIKEVCANWWYPSSHFFITDFKTNQMFLFLFSCFTIASRNEW